MIELAYVTSSHLAHAHPVLVPGFLPVSRSRDIPSRTLLLSYKKDRGRAHHYFAGVK